MKTGKPYIIAEVAQGYEGSEKLVELYVRSASFAGADAVKFQIFYADELALPDYKYYGLFKGLELPYDVWERAVKEAHGKGMEFYSDVFGTESLAMLEKIGVDGFKVHTTDINNTRLLRLVAASRRKVLLSTGGCTMEEIKSALDILGACDVTLMYGFQAEPTETEDNNLNRVETLKRSFNRPVGFQDHTGGDSALAMYMPFAALGAGVEVVEKHLTLSRVAQIEDFISALTPEEFKNWALLIKEAWRGLGKREWELTEKEALYRGKVRRAVCASGDIKKGDVFSEDNLLLKRTDNQDAIFDIRMVIGKSSKRAIKDNTVIEKGDIS